MKTTEQLDINSAAYHQRLKKHIDEKYPTGHFVAIAGGEIVADSASFWDLHAWLKARPEDSPKAIVVQSGMYCPEMVTIFPFSRSS